MADIFSFFNLTYIGCGVTEVVEEVIGIDGGAIKLKQSGCMVEFPIKALKSNTNIKIESFQPPPGALLLCDVSLKVSLTKFLSTSC